MFPEELRQTLLKVLVSQACLSDEIHDARKCGEDVAHRRKKMKFWEKAAEILRNAIAEIERELEILGKEQSNE